MFKTSLSSKPLMRSKMSANKNDAINTNSYDEVRYIRCAYDRRHFVLSQKYDAHLEKCRRNHPNVHLLFCPFNTTHRCRNMEMLVRSIYGSATKLKEHRAYSDFFWFIFFHLYRANISMDVPAKMRSATSRQMKVPTDEAISVIIIRRKKHKRI